MSSKLIKDPNERVLAVIQITNKGVMCEAPGMPPQTLIILLQNFITNLMFQNFQPRERSLIQPVGVVEEEQKIDS